MRSAEEQTRTRAFLAAQRDAFERLVGFEVIEWRGREMAHDEGPEGPIWRLRDVEVRQFDRMQLIGATSSAWIGTMQSSRDYFGLFCPDEYLTTLPGGDFGWVIPVDDSPFASRPDSIFRDVRVPELPMGTIDHVSVRFSVEELEVEAVTMRIAGHVVSLTAGEVHPVRNGSPLVTSLDESILVQVDDRYPGSPVA